MPIRPIDMQVSIPKLPELSRMSHLEQQKAGLHQNQGELSNKKSNQKEKNSVAQSHKDAKSGNDADARKEGRNKYTNNLRKGQQKENDVDQPPKSIHKIDIRI